MLDHSRRSRSDQFGRGRRPLSIRERERGCDHPAQRCHDDRDVARVLAGVLRPRPGELPDGWDSRTPIPNSSTTRRSTELMPNASPTAAQSRRRPKNLPPHPALISTRGRARRSGCTASSAASGAVARSICSPRASTTRSSTRSSGCARERREAPRPARGDRQSRANPSLWHVRAPSSLRWRN